MPEIDEEHGGVTDEDLEAFFNSHPGLRPIAPLNGADPTLPVQFQSGQGRVVPPAGGIEDSEEVPPPPPSSPPAVGDEGEGTEGGGGDGHPAEPSPPSPPPPPSAPSVEFVEFEGQQIPASQLRALLDWQQSFASDAELQRLVTGHLVGRSTPVEGGAPASAPAAGVPSSVSAGAQPLVAPLTAPPDLDLEDPAIAALWGLIQQQNTQLQALSTTTQATQETFMATQRANADATYRRAAESFRAAHELEPADVQTISEVASRLQVLPSLLTGIDPLTGVAVKPDPLAAMERALEIAYFTMPEYRTREFQRSVKQQQADATRKKNLAAVAGSPGSVARTTTPPRPGTNESREAMVKEVAQMIAGEWTGENNN